VLVDVVGADGGPQSAVAVRKKLGPPAAPSPQRANEIARERILDDLHAAPATLRRIIEDGRVAADRDVVLVDGGEPDAVVVLRGLLFGLPGRNRP
jgi:hypothetical protein